MSTKESRLRCPSCIVGHSAGPQDSRFKIQIFSLPPGFFDIALSPPLPHSQAQHLLYYTTDLPTQFSDFQSLKKSPIFSMANCFLSIDQARVPVLATAEEFYSAAPIAILDGSDSDSDIEFIAVRKVVHAASTASMPLSSVDTTKAAPAPKRPRNQMAWLQPTTNMHLAKSQGVFSTLAEQVPYEQQRFDLLEIEEAALAAAERQAEREKAAAQLAAKLAAEALAKTTKAGKPRAAPEPNALKAPNAPKPCKPVPSTSVPVPAARPSKPSKKKAKEAKWAQAKEAFEAEEALDSNGAAEAPPDASTPSLAETASTAPTPGEVCTPPTLTYDYLSDAEDAEESDGELVIEDHTKGGVVERWSYGRGSGLVQQAPVAQKEDVGGEEDPENDEVYKGLFGWEEDAGKEEDPENDEVYNQLFGWDEE